MIDSLFKTFDFIPPKTISFWDKIIYFKTFDFARQSPTYFYQMGVVFFVWFVVGSMLVVWYLDRKKTNYRPVLFVSITVWILFIFVLGKMVGALGSPMNYLSYLH